MQKEGEVKWWKAHNIWNSILILVMDLQFQSNVIHFSAFTDFFFINHLKATSKNKNEILFWYFAAPACHERRHLINQLELRDKTWVYVQRSIHNTYLLLKRSLSRY